MSLKRQDGFTLVELMVVVAIIGLLSAVAIPNFRKYQAKAKMSEAKLQLSSVYTAQTSFYSDFNIYSNCLAFMGYNPQREIGNRYFAIGIVAAGAIDDAAYAAATNSGISTTDCPDGNAGGNPGTASTAVVSGTTSYYLAGKGVGSAIANAVGFMPTTLVGDQANQTNMTFVAGAGGVIDGDNTLPAQASQLTINQQKSFRIIRNGY